MGVGGALPKDVQQEGCFSEEEKPWVTIQTQSFILLDWQCSADSVNIQTVDRAASPKLKLRSKLRALTSTLPAAVHLLCLCTHLNMASVVPDHARHQRDNALSF